MAIDIGAEAINRGTTTSEGFTYIDKNNPANESGTITTVEIWAYSVLANCVVGTFYVVSGNTLKCRDSVVIGDVPRWSKQTFSGLSLAVEEGDYIGFYVTSGQVERDQIGYDGNWRLVGEYIDPGDEATYGFLYGDAFSVHGIGNGVAEIEGSALGSGIGLASSSGKLDVLASALGNGIGLSQSSAYLIIPAAASGSGEGIAEAIAKLLVLAQASGNGIGLGEATGEIVVVGNVVTGAGAGSGIGDAVRVLLGQAVASGAGAGVTDALLDVLAQAQGSGESSAMARTAPPVVGSKSANMGSKMVAAGLI
jgi:hypothetical protein